MQQKLIDLLNIAGDSKLALELQNKHIADETKEAKAVIESVKAKYASAIEAISKRMNDARVKLQEAIDQGLIPEQGLETDDWKLVQVKRLNPMLEDFNNVPDEFLLPVAQWIDWKKVDDYVRQNARAPEGMTIVASYAPRVMANQKVKV